MPKKALIVGATGLIGEQLLGLLAESDKYSQITVLSRRNIDYPQPKVKVEVVNFESLNPEADFWEADDIFCCLGTTMKTAGSKEAFRQVDYEYPLRVAQLSKNKGANGYHIVSALGADPSSSVFYNKVKGEIEESINSIGFDEYHIYRPSLLFGDRKEFRFGEKLGIYFAKAIGFLMVGPLKKYRGIHSAKVAKAMFANAQKSESGYFIHESAEMQKYQA